MVSIYQFFSSAISFKTIEDTISTVVFFAFILLNLYIFIKLILGTSEHKTNTVKNIFISIHYSFSFAALMFAMQFSRPQIDDPSIHHRYSVAGEVNGIEILGYHIAAIFVFLAILVFVWSELKGTADKKVNEKY